MAGLTKRKFAPQTAWDEAEELRKELQRRRGGKYPLEFVHAVGWSLDPWQEKFYLSKARFRLVNCSRQSGKSTTGAITATHRAFYNPGSTILCVCPTLRQSKEFLRKVVDFIRKCPVTVQLDQESMTLIEFANGSRVISLPASEANIRGFTANLIIEDEAGDIDDDVHRAILPMLAASRGDLVLMGTPKGRRGHFFDSWERGGDIWERYKITAAQCPRIDPADLELQRRVLGPLFAREYEGEFIEAATGLVYGGYDELRNNISQLPEPITSPAWRFMCGVDFGYTKDATAIVVLGYRTGDPTVYVIQSQKLQNVDAAIIAERIKTLPFKFSRIVVDSLGRGKETMDEIRRRHHLPLEPAPDRQNKRGWIELLNSDFRTGAIKILKDTNSELIREICSLPWDEGREKESAAFDNHACDALLYIWKACTAYLTKPIAVDPTVNTPAFQDALKKARDRFEANRAHFDDPKKRNDFFSFDESLFDEFGK